MELDNKKTRNVITGTLIGILYLTLLLFGLSGCGVLGKSGGENSTNTKTNEAISDTTSTKRSGGGSYFDQSLISEEDSYLNWEPVDPAKEMKIINPDGSVTKSTNAKATRGKKKTNTNSNKGGNYYSREEIDRLMEQEKATEIDSEEQWYKKLRISIPWYAYLIGAMVLGFFWYVRRSNKKIKTLKNLIP